MPTCSMLRAAAAMAVASVLLVPPLLAQPSLSISGTTVTEGNASSVQAVVTVTLTPASSGVVTVNFESSPATPAATGGAACGGGVDFVNPVGTVRFDPGVVSQTITVAVCGDTADEPDEKFRVRLVSPVGATIATSQGPVTILDDDAPTAPVIPAAPVIPRISVSDATIVEPDAGTTLLFLSGTLSSPTTQFVTVQGQIVSGTVTVGACAQGADIDTITSATFTFSPGQTSLSVPITICGDTVVEPDESFQIEISNPIGAILGDSVGQATITNNDRLPTLAITPQVVVNEPRAGAQALAVFTVTLSGAPTTATVSVAFATVPGTARPGSVCAPLTDYLLLVGGLTFSPGATTRRIQVPICGDFIGNDREGSETFTVILLNPVNATILSGTGRATIQD